MSYTDAPPAVHQVPELHIVKMTTCGGERTRTADFYVANVALYQLSYTPGVGTQNSAGPVPTQFLLISLGVTPAATDPVYPSVHLANT